MNKSTINDILYAALSSGGDFAVLSAGADYYIEKVLKHHGVEDVILIANKGIYENKGIKMTADNKSPYYSSLYGIDKGAVIQALKKEYKKVYFAGDSSPDLPAAKAADVAFARNELAKLLAKDEKVFIPYTSFSTIKDYIF
jgi:2,3-diketo-5-methylthio-1-phosphopentane phosphatase